MLSARLATEVSMGIGVSGQDKGGRRRGVSAELNLVPFIDLLSVCITFLLLTAVWTQVQALPVDQGTGEGDAGDATPLTVHLRTDGISVGREAVAGLAMTADEYDWHGLLVAIDADRALHPDAADALLVTDDGVQYQHMIRAFDRLRAEGYDRTLVVGAAR
jgi:biopolymer transport protein ExbD